MRRLGRNWGVKVVAFVITIFLCVNAETESRVEVECTVPITFAGLPDSLVPMGEAPTHANVRVVFNRRFWQVQPRDLVAVLDLSEARRGTQRFIILPGDIEVPHDRNATVVEVVEPNRVALSFESKIDRVVKAYAISDGVPEDEHVIFGEPKTEPDRVALRGAKSILDKIDAVYTLPVDLTGVVDDVRATRAIDLSRHKGVLCDPTEVEAYFNIEKIESVTLEARPIRVSPRAGTRIEPDSLDIVVRGPGAMLAEIPESRIRLSLNVASLPSGEHSFLAEVIEGNRIRCYARAAGDEVPEGGEPPVLPELEGAIQNLPDQVVVIDFSPKTFRIVRGAR